MPQGEFRNFMGWVNYPQQHQTYLDACFEASLRRGLPGANIFSDSVINHKHYFNLQCTYYSCHCVIAMAIKFWANLKPEEETIMRFFVNEKNLQKLENNFGLTIYFPKSLIGLFDICFRQQQRPTNYYHRQRVMVFNITITIGAIISAQPLGSIIFRWFSDKR